MWESAVIFLFALRYSPLDPNQAILIMGDTEGGVCIMEFSRATSYLFIPAVGSSNHVTFHELLEQKYDGVRTTYFPKVQRRDYGFVCTYSIIT